MIVQEQNINIFLPAASIAGLMTTFKPMALTFGQQQSLLSTDLHPSCSSNTAITLNIGMHKPEQTV